MNSPPANRARSSTRTDAGKLPTSSSGPDHMPVLVLFQSLPSAYTCAITAIDEQFDPVTELLSRVCQYPDSAR